MNPFLNILGLQNPGDAKGMIPLGGQPAVDGKITGMVFSEILALGMTGDQEMSFMENILGAGTQETQGNILNIPQAILPLGVNHLEENPQLLQEQNSGNEAVPTDDVIIVQPVSMMALPEGIATVAVPDEASQANAINNENEEIPINVKNHVLMPQVKLQSEPEAIQRPEVYNSIPQNVNIAALRTSVAAEPTVIIEDNLKPVNPEVKGDEAKAVDVFKSVLNIKELQINSAIKEQPVTDLKQVNTPAPVRITDGTNISQGQTGEEEAAFDMNREAGSGVQSNVSLKELALKTDGDKGTFEALFDGKAVESKSQSAEASVQVKTDADMTVQSQSSSTNIMETEKIQAPPVRFVVPSELNDGKNLDNRTVMIKMEPEHLGPVRMTLTTFHDGLSARLVVDTAAAKTAVESNLNQLMQQLDRQGIRVEAFQVSVGGSQVGENSGDRTMARFGKGTARSQKSFGNYSIQSAIVGGTNRLGQYIGAGGVNCFA